MPSLSLYPGKTESAAWQGAIGAPAMPDFTSICHHDHDTITIAMSIMTPLPLP
jgi:hypothetical protein